MSKFILPLVVFIMILMNSCAPVNKGNMNISLSVDGNIHDPKVGDTFIFHLNVEPRFAGMTGEIRVNDITIAASDTFPIDATWTARKRGYYTVVGIVRSNFFGEERSDEINFRVKDGTPPVITQVEMVPNRPEPGESMNVFVNVQDEESERFFVEVNVDDDVFTYSSWFDSKPFIIPVDENLCEGYHTLRITVQNEDGLDTTTSTTFKVMRKDGVLPYINMNCPDVVYKGQKSSCIIEVRDMESGLKRIHVNIDSTTVKDEMFDEPWIGTYSFSVDLPATPFGNHTVEVSAWDDYGNPRKETKVYTAKSVSSFNVKLNITGDFVSGGYITINASHDSLSDIIASTFTVDCAPNYCLPVENKGILQGVWRAVGGDHTIGVILLNSNGKIGSAIETIHIEDNIGPVFNLTEPEVSSGRIAISLNKSFLIDITATDTGDGMIPDGEANAIIIKEGVNIIDIITLTKQPVDSMGKVARFTGVAKPIDTAGEYEMRISVKDNSNNESAQSFILEVR